MDAHAERGPVPATHAAAPPALNAVAGHDSRRPPRRILSVWLANLAIDRWRLATMGQEGAPRGDAPVVLIADTAHGPRITAVTPAARDRGAMPGMRLADARALAPDLVAVPGDPAGDRALLDRLALWAQRWGPWSAIDGADGLLVDITGTDRLLGSETRIVRDVVARLASAGAGSGGASESVSGAGTDGAGFVACVGIAPTAGAAWALARHGPQAGLPVILPADADPDEALGPLPVRALRLDGATLGVLRRLGLRTIGDVMAMGRTALARRFRHVQTPAANPLVRLDQLTGRMPEPLLPVIAAPPLRVERRLADPIRHRMLFDRVVGDLMLDLVRLLEADGCGARRIDLAAFRVDGVVTTRRVELAQASRDPAHLERLMAHRLDGIDAGFGFDCMQLVASWIEPVAAAQADLDAAAERHGTCLAAFVDRVSVRLGADAVRRLAPAPSHWPERAARTLAPLAPLDVPSAGQGGEKTAPRPLTLLDPAEPITVVYATPEGVPRRFRWRGQVHDIVRVEGPERIAPEWWRERSTARLRDYYRIEATGGGRYWIFRRGLFGDGRGGVPDWFVHGLFA